jgi:ferredoxin
MAYKITDICVACGTCIDECPVGAISEGDIYKIDENACVSCGVVVLSASLIIAVVVWLMDVAFKAVMSAVYPN